MEARRWQIGELVSFSPEGVTRRMLVSNERARSALLCLKQGQEIGEHPAPGHAFVHVLSGRIALGIGTAAPETVGRGAYFYLPPGTPHRLRALRDSAVLIAVALA